LPHVGNDVVDWKDPANAKKSRDIRFLRKILTDDEIEFVNDAECPDIELWALWAGKETAYKVLKKSVGKASFLPRRWTVQPTKSEKKQKDWEVILPGEEKIFIRPFLTDNYVHCIGSDDLFALDKVIYGVEQMSAADAENIFLPSTFVRECLASVLADYFHLNYRDIEIRREKVEGELHPPCIYYEDKKYPVDISLSHDGRFVAYAFI
jgi:phosphopantetheinyl transferase (holo-ACP synthase)